MSFLSTPTHSSAFDPARPLEHTTLRNFRATGVGQASPKRLNAFIGIGLAGAAMTYFGFPRAWLLSTPFICLACFGIWGRTAQMTYLMQVKREDRPTFRRLLRGVRWTMVLIGLTALFTGLIGLVVLLLEPNSL
ncbi:MAG TPA: hypothetical protein VJ672_15525 [Gemmatimonadaceae bacterium]|nr:hypothetical protein [Gemmatimonadaceae bacterium]